MFLSFSIRRFFYLKNEHYHFADYKETVIELRQGVCTMSVVSDDHDY